MEGVVIKSTGSWYRVRAEDGQYYNCRLRGSMRMKGSKNTNPVAVGDKVRMEMQEKENNALIREVLERKNYIIRKATKLSRISHVIAANIDQALLVVTLSQPRTSTGFIDRFLVTTEAYHIPAKLIFNKLDIYNEKEKEKLKELTHIYLSAGYPCLAISAETGENIDKLKDEMKNKTALFSGHSGVGKSSIINAIEPGMKLKTGNISSYHQKGKHVTTFAEMHELSFGGYIIDTPGIKEFGLRDFVKEEVAERFPEMRALMWDCKFHNCTHVHEPGCAVKAAVEEGKISASRYNNYLGILQDDYFEDKEWDLK